MTAKELKDAALTEKRAYYRKWRVSVNSGGL